MNMLLTCNPSLFMHNDNERIYVKEDEEFKCIDCDPAILNRVLNIFSIPNTIEAVYEEFINEKQYTKNDIQNFINVLVDESILIKVECATKCNKAKIMVVGCGKLKDTFVEICDEKNHFLEQVKVEDFLDMDNIDSDVVLLIDDNISIQNSLVFNEKMLKMNKPFFVVRYNGLHLIIGPFVFPWSTSCLGCQYTHHLVALEKKIKTTIAFSSYYNGFFAKPIIDEYKDFQLKAILFTVLQDLEGFYQNNYTYSYIEKECFYHLNSYEKSHEKRYRAITSCPHCNGMNQNFCKIENINELIISEKQFNEMEQNIKYNTGGFRSKTTEETKQLLSDTMNKLDLEINISLVEDNPFDSVIPVYDSEMKSSHNNKSKYILEEQSSYGKGINKTQAYFSAAFELFERISSRYYGEKKIVRGSAKELKKYIMNCETISENIRNSHTPFDKFNEELDIDWVWGQSLITGEMKLVPASLVFLSTVKFKGKFVGSTSSGLSSGGTKEDAILQGLFEVLEHDAWMIGQAAPCKLPILDYKTCKGDKVNELVSLINELGYKVITRDYTNDIGIPAFRTWISNPNSHTVYATNGFGASISAELALERSLTEAIQSGLKIPYSNIEIYRADVLRNMTGNRNSLYGLHYFQQKDIRVDETDSIRSIDYYEEKSYASVREVLNEVIRKVCHAVPNADIIAVDLTREFFNNIPAVRVIGTGDLQTLNIPLISVSPRLYKFQKNMGYGDELQYDQLYMGNYPH